jgi:hypothetical protein
MPFVDFWACVPKFLVMTRFFFAMIASPSTAQYLQVCDGDGRNSTQKAHMFLGDDQTLDSKKGRFRN